MDYIWSNKYITILYSLKNHFNSQHVQSSGLLKLMLVSEILIIATVSSPIVLIPIKAFRSFKVCSQFFSLMRKEDLGTKSNNISVGPT